MRVRGWARCPWASPSSELDTQPPGGPLTGDEIAVLASLEDAEEAFALLAPLGTADAEDFARGGEGCGASCWPVSAAEGWTGGVAGATGQPRLEAGRRAGRQDWMGRGALRVTVHSPDGPVDVLVAQLKSNFGAVHGEVAAPNPRRRGQTGRVAEPRENAADLVGQAVADLQVPLDGGSRARAEDAVLFGMHTGAFPYRVSRFRWLIAAEQHAQDLLPPAPDQAHWSGAVLHWLPVRTVTDGRKFHAPDCEDAPTGPVSEPTPLRQLRTRDLCGRCGGFAPAYAPGLVALVVLGEPTDRFSVSREAWRTALLAALEVASELGTVPSQAERESRRPAP